MKDQREDGNEAPASEEQPFSHETLVLFQRALRASSKEERTRLMLELGAQFAADHDPSDPSATDDYHTYFEEHAKAKLALEQASLRIARLATECIQQYLTASDTTIEQVTTEVTRSLN